MNKIKTYRKKIKVTQEELGQCAFPDSIGSQSRVANYENCRRTPSIQDAYAIVRALKMLGSTADFIDVFPEITEPERLKTTAVGEV